MKRIIVFSTTFTFSFLIMAQPTIQAIKVNGKKRELNNQGLKLAALEDDLIFEFQPSDVDSFVFLLEKYDAQPVKTAYPTIRYTHLVGDYYTLNYWTEKNNVKSIVAQINVEVEQSLTETSWFYPTVVACVVIGLGIIFYFWSIYDLRQKIKLETIRSRIARDLHDEIGSDLGSIVLSIGTAQRKFGKDETELSLKLEEIKEATRSTAANLRDTVWIIQPNNDALPQLLDKIRTFSTRMLTAVKCHLIFENQLAVDDNFSISMEQRRCVYLMLREAVHNIAKHAHATQATIDIQKEKDGIRINVTDNGVGFNTSATTGDGNGLKNLKSGSKTCFIDVFIKSTPSVGTTISMFIPEL